MSDSYNEAAEIVGYFALDPEAPEDATDGFILCPQHRDSYIGSGEMHPIRRSGSGRAYLPCSVCGKNINGVEE